MSIDINVTFDPIQDIPSEAYLALRGLKGDRGDTGLAGRDGVDGVDGVDGINGIDGIGIASITQNDDSSLTITLTDGTEFMTGELKGADGRNGDDGNGIVSITQNLDGTLTITLDDGTEFITEPLKGADGADGTDGVSPTVSFSDITGGHSMTVVDAGGTHSINIMDGSAGSKGDKGDKGDTGDDGRGITSIAKTGTVGLVDTYTITYSDGTTSTYTVTNGQDGSGGGGTFELQVDWGSETVWDDYMSYYPMLTSHADVLDAIDNGDLLFVIDHGGNRRLCTYYQRNDDDSIRLEVICPYKYNSSVLNYVSYDITYTNGPGTLMYMRMPLMNADDIPTYTAGNGISISNGVISLDLSQAEGGRY